MSSKRKDSQTKNRRVVKAKRTPQLETITLFYFPSEILLEIIKFGTISDCLNLALSNKTHLYPKLLTHLHHLKLIYQNIKKDWVRWKPLPDPYKISG